MTVTAKVREDLLKGDVQWVDIKRVIPNPLNPRRNESIKREELQKVIKERGWEEPLTCYMKGKNFILLAGHRRHHAAKTAGIDTVPVYIVSAPKSEQEELERIASLQSHRVDWQPYDWALFTYERWLAWGKPPVARFAKEVNIGASMVKQYINVLTYYPRNEIENDLQLKTLSVSGLEILRRWIEALKKHKPDLVLDMGEDLIRKTMIQKMIDRKAGLTDLKNNDYCEQATDEQIREFLVDKNAVLENQLGYVGVKKRYKDFTGHLISIGHMKNRIPNIKPESELQKESALKELEELRKMIESQINSIAK